MEAHKKNRIQGFTLVELLVVIGIIVILFSVILVAVDPARRLQQARDAVRRQDVRDILEAVQEFMVDNDGDFPTGIDSVTASFQVLGTAGSGCNTTCTAETTVAACLDLSGDLVETYLADIPQDPKTGTATNTDYAINKTAGDRIEVTSCDPEVAGTISVKR
jgi:type IV pilus assembly protein PilA